MLVNNSRTSWRHSPMADYFRARPGSVVTRSLGKLLKAWRCINPRPVKRVVPMDRLLCGGEHGLPAAAYARHTGDFLRPSRAIAQSPHALFLDEYARIGDEIFRPERFRETAYFANAVQCIETVGQYCRCTREDQVEQVARNFINRFQGKPIHKLGGPEALEFSAAGSMVRVRPIEFSDCYEVIDGNHRLAIALARGEKSHGVLVEPCASRTPLQQLLMDYAWCAMRGEREIYQPVASPELGSHWTLIRRCTDRFALIEQFIARHRDALPERPTYLDIACSYGWFVSAFSSAGFDARGVELDWAAIEIGRRVYGLRPDQVTRSEAARFLESNPESRDVVSCFSLLHHFVLNTAGVSAVEMLKRIDRATRSILFLDMGEEHEEWFRHSLAGWGPGRIEEWLRENSSFTRIFRLGTDQDNVPPFEKNYGRTLFACMR